MTYDVWEKKYECNIPCEITMKHEQEPNADAIWIHFWDYSDDMVKEIPAVTKGRPLIGYTGECPGLVYKLSKEEVMNQFNFMYSYRLDAAAYFSFLYSEDDLFNTPVPWSEKDKNEVKVAFVASNCNMVTNSRNAYVTELQKHIKVDSLGKCMRNKNPTSNNKRDMIKNYKFLLSFENSNCNDYVTEKVYDGMYAGVVPVYMGAPNVEDIIPFNHSIIKVSDFRSPKALAKYLLKLDKDEELYNSYLWYKKYTKEDKLKTFTPSYLQVREKAKNGTICGVCNLVYQYKESNQPFPINHADLSCNFDTKVEIEPVGFSDSSSAEDPTQTPTLAPTQAPTPAPTSKPDETPATTTPEGTITPEGTVTPGETSTTKPDETPVITPNRTKKPTPRPAAKILSRYLPTTTKPDETPVITTNPDEKPDITPTSGENIVPPSDEYIESDELPLFSEDSAVADAALIPPDTKTDGNPLDLGTKTGGSSQAGKAGEGRAGSGRVGEYYEESPEYENETSLFSYFVQATMLFLACFAVYKIANRARSRHTPAVRGGTL
eukprot:Phypoly_transcript_06202.p1 GENE.Phypoly_transcript_06202~~Phypoly_transcript_06202.p1  ORF type:complete len:603 (+),score=94.83 Phypoly_transcript_06202:168-1811(+)